MIEEKELEKYAEELSQKDKGMGSWTGEWSDLTYEESRENSRYGFKRGFKVGVRWGEEQLNDRMHKLEAVAEAARQTVIAAERMKNTSGGIHRISLALAALDDDK